MKILKSRVLKGTGIIFAIAMIVGIVGDLMGVLSASGVGRVSGLIIFVWWIYCFATRKEKGKHNETPHQPDK